MPDAAVRFVPEAPTYQPTASEAKSAEALLLSYFPDSEKIESRFYDTTQFIDAGSNWSGVECPKCRSNLEAWWSTAMDRAQESSFSDLAYELPCCKALISLNELEYPWQVAFGCYVLEVLNPASANLDDDEVEKLARTIGAPLTQVFVHI